MVSTKKTLPLLPPSLEHYTVGFCHKGILFLSSEALVIQRREIRAFRTGG